MSDFIKRDDAMELLDMLLEHYHDTGIEVIKHTAAIAPKEFHISEEDEIADFNFVTLPISILRLTHGKRISQTFRLPMLYQYGTEGGKSLMQKSREDTDVLNAKGFRGTWKTSAKTAAQRWMR